jgi:hypothetical protein
VAIEGDIQTVLAALVSGRCYPMVAPDPVAKPYIVYQVISDVMENTLKGYSGCSSKRVQVDIYHNVYGGVKTLMELVRTSMSVATNIKNVHLSTQDLYEDEAHLYRISMDFLIWN